LELLLLLKGRNHQQLELLLLLNRIYGDRHVNTNNKTIYNIEKVRTTYNVRTYIWWRTYCAHSTWELTITPNAICEHSI